MTATPVCLAEVRATIEKSFQSGEPIPAGAAALLGSASNVQTLQVLRTLRVRDVVYRPTPGLSRYAKRLFFRGQAEFSLVDALRQHLRGARARPPAAEVCRATHAEWHQAVCLLPEPLRSRLTHLYQVQLAHGLLRHHLLPLVGMTFGVRQGPLPPPTQFVDLAGVRAHWLRLVRETGEGYVQSVLQEGRLEVAAGGVVHVRSSRVWDFSFAPSSGGQRRRVLDPNCRRGVDAGLALHAGMEQALCSGLYGVDAVLPEVWVASPDGAPFPAETDDPSDRLAASALAKLWACREAGGPGDALRAAVSAAADPRQDAALAWVDVLAEAAAAGVVLPDTDNADALFACLGEYLPRLLEAVWLADHVRLSPGTVLLPLGHFVPGSPAQPHARRLYARFQPAVRGRDAWAGGALYTDPDQGAVQVFADGGVDGRSPGG